MGKELAYSSCFQLISYIRGIARTHGFAKIACQNHDDAAIFSLFNAKDKNQDLCVTLCN
ncbi:MAG: hypothetical protein ABIJ59_07810 [Pseudomonadota bacterium]